MEYSLLDYFDPPVNSKLEQMYIHNKKSQPQSKNKKQNKNQESLKIVFWNMNGLSNKLSTNERKLDNITYLEEWMDEWNGWIEWMDG